MEEKLAHGSTEKEAAKAAEEECVNPASCVRPGCGGCAELYARLRVALSERGFWRKMHAKAKAREVELAARVAKLEGKLRKRERQLFGKKTERGGGGQGKGGGRTEKKPEEKRPRGQQKGTKGHGRRTQGALGEEEEFRSLDEDERVCPDCGGTYEDTGLTEDSEVVEVEVKAHRRRIRRKRCRRPCDCPELPRTLTAPPAPTLIPRGAYGSSFWVLVLLDKFLFQRPSHRLLAFCWAHVRRDFLDIAKDWPLLEEWGLDWVERIGELYALNKNRLAVLDDPVAFSKAQGALVASVDAMEAERDAQLATPTLPPACHKVLDSLKRHWSGLVVFVAHPEVPMDNSQAERDLRNPVVGRKNFRGSGSVWAGQLLVMAISLSQTLLAWGVDPRLWLLSYFDRCAELGGVAPDDAVRWLPWNPDEDELFELRPLASQPLDTS